MKFVAVVAVLSLATPAFTGDALWYDTIYDQKGDSLNNVACSTGEYGLITRGFHTFGDLPAYPFIGGAPQILSWNSPYCGSCWELTYTDPNGIVASLSFMAINTGPQGGFSISREGMDRLTGGNAQTLDGLTVSVDQLGDDSCGLSN